MSITSYRIRPLNRKLIYDHQNMIGIIVFTFSNLLVLGFIVIKRCHWSGRVVRRLNAADWIGLFWKIRGLLLDLDIFYDHLIWLRIQSDDFFGTWRILLLSQYWVCFYRLTNGVMLWKCRNITYAAYGMRQWNLFPPKRILNWSNPSSSAGSFQIIFSSSTWGDSILPKKDEMEVAVLLVLDSVVWVVKLSFKLNGH